MNLACLHALRACYTQVRVATYWSIIVALISLAVSVGALVVVVLKKTAGVDSTARHLYADLHSEVRKIDSDVDDLYDRFKRLTARKGMQARREETKQGAMLPGESPDAWKRRMRKARQNGAQLETPEEV